MNLESALLPTSLSDLETLVQMRIAAMRESLERLGRFDPQRARERFAASFAAERCHFILSDGQPAGFIQSQSHGDHLRLQHLYVLPQFQGRGLGAKALEQLLERSANEQLPIHLDALRGSDSNRFYRRLGFVQVGESEWDIHYVRPADPPQA
ncbi:MULTISPECIES: GNAT family N-acetyltransferase [Pseudomonas]|jgi:ribosomal protein S18 acetylase RimI-like enzyme|uniref:Acetyltransferase, GNAT family n=1 Tax=Pseudomonas protegens (strain DSM 19095 / LMG 27888 / CFBP 6595 / CHA0) TaxID=1124983 RepID=A0A2C9ETH5_PSEPH|nr:MULTISPECIES: GNAT family N-acetyltransferase [Pseudomonas]AGL86909.1 acetyltransferase, GNAT family [Pseudomonas protegens CHA0]MBB1611957.1 GNAT family acetyltransferase [Pseudomonas sp. UMC65]MBB1622092.1 GNAT family acetyltransferase [Pseudomonas sp. UME65]MBP5096367.1 GNAT family N-acetyltransferase [Pseudomonas protegens]MBP5111680.1 GNAT family N-acetyltransferase [Pseudomonas protegens]